MPKIEQAKLHVVAEFPTGYFLENLAVRADNSVLVTAMNKRELWLVPPAGEARVEPLLLHTFDRMTMFVVEMEPDVFVVGTADVYASNRASLYRIDLRGWQPGDPVIPTLVLEFPAPYLALNGGCMIAPGVLLAGAATHLIWRVDFPADGGAPAARIWMQHDTMQFRPGEKTPEQPGVNGIRFAPQTGALYYTSTAQQLMMRVLVDPVTHDPVELPAFVAGGRYWDDFVIDEDAGVAYVTTHRENTIDRVRLAPDGNREGRSAIAGDPFTPELVGPSSGAWSRALGDHGRVAFFITDGGVAQSPDGTVRPGRLLRVELPTA